MATTEDTTERWLPISGWEGMYEVSDLGRIRSLPRRVICYGKAGRHLRRRVLTPKFNTTGYPQAHLFRGGKRYVALVHRLVAAAFIGPLDGMEVDHINSIKTDCRVGNLRIVSHLENIHATIARGRGASGERCGHAKITERDVRWARRQYADGVCPASIARAIGLSPTATLLMLQRKTWAQVT
jgi:hypothetical protein